MTEAMNATLSCRDVTVIVPSETEYGSMNPAALERFRREVLRSADKTPTDLLVLDLSQVEYWGAAFLGVLAGIDRELRYSGRQVVVYGDSRNLIVQARLDALLPRFATLREAICSTIIA